MTALLQEHFFLNDSNHTLDMADSVSDSVSLSSFDNASTHSNSKATSSEDKKVRATTTKKRNRKRPALEQQEQQRQDQEPHALPLHATTTTRRRSNNEDDKNDSIYEVSIRPDPEFGFGLKLGCVLKGGKRVTIIHSLQKHPKGSHRLLPAEATGKLRLMDQLLAVNGVNVQAEAFQIICGHIRLLGMGLKMRPSEFLTLRFKKYKHPAAAAAAVATNVADAATNTINKEKPQHSSAAFQSPNSIANHTFADGSNSSTEGKNKNNSSSSIAGIFRSPDSIQIVKKRGSISSIDEPAPKPDSLNILITNRRGSVSSLEETSASKLVFKPASSPSTTKKRRRSSSSNSSWPLPRRHVSLNSTASKKAPPTAVVTAATLPKKRTRSNTTAATAATTGASAVATTTTAAATTSKNKDQNDNTTHPPEDDFEPWSIDHEHNHDDHDDDEEGNWKTTGLVDP